MSEMVISSGSAKKRGRPWGSTGKKKEAGAKHAFQVVFNLPYEDVDCFQYTDPTVVPAQTFLSQLA